MIEIPTIESLHARFMRILNFLDPHLNDYQMADIINAKHNLLPNNKKQNLVSPAYFSKYRNPSKYPRQVNTKTFSKMVKYLEEYVAKHYQDFWSSLNSPETNNSLDYKRLNGLIGTWEAYSWDEGATKDSGGVGHIHCFKIDIPALSVINCTTKRTTLKGTKIDLISPDRVAIQISNSLRKIFIIIHIGNGELEDILKETEFKLAYNDSGRNNVKAGLAIIKRSEKQFEEIISESKPVTFFSDKDSKSFIKFLEGKQLIVE
jgi:hypothetical protein